MKLRRFFGAVLLTVALTVPTFAGTMITGVADPPPPPPTDTTTSTAATQDTQSTNTDPTSAGAATEAVLTVVQNFIALV